MPQSDTAEDLVSTMLPAGGPLRGSVEERFTVSRPEPQQGRAQRLGRFDNQAGVLGGSSELSGLRRVEVMDQLHTQLVADERLRLAGAQAFGADPQGEAYDVKRGLGTEHVAQRIPIPGRNLGGQLDGVEDEALTAQHEERHVTTAGVGGPAQQADRLLLAHQGGQVLASTVPIDEEHQPRTQVLEVGPQGCPGGGHMASGDEMVLPERGRAPAALRVRTTDGDALEHPLEELQPLKMDVGVGHRHHQPFDGDDDDVSLCLADVILDQQASTRARRSGTETAVIELERGRCLQPGHEGSHERPIAVPQVVRESTINGLGGDLGLKTIESTVGVHDQKVERVARARSAEATRPM